VTVVEGQNRLSSRDGRNRTIIARFNFESPVTGCPTKLFRCCEPAIEDPERRPLGNFEAAYVFPLS
jgi:hypothetical protein